MLRICGYYNIIIIIADLVGNDNNDIIIHLKLIKYYEKLHPVCIP
jgi:hypothetical protein